MRLSQLLVEKYETLLLEKKHEKNKRDELLNKFVKFAFDTLDIKNPPKIKFDEDEYFGSKNKSFGQFFPHHNRIIIATSNRNLADIMRTLGHELVHCKQCEDGKIDLENPKESGKDGSDLENEANSRAAVMMREFGRTNPDIYE